MPVRVVHSHSYRFLTLIIKLFPPHPMNRFDKFVIEMDEGKIRCDVMMQRVKASGDGIQRFRDQLRWVWVC